MYLNEAWGKPRDESRLPNPRGNGFWTQEIYYHLLNCGIRIPPSAGSASGVLKNPVGYNRVYVQLQGQEFTRDNWFGSLAAGRCFVTNGPLLRVAANQHWSGHSFRQGQSIDLKIQLASNDAVSQIQLIFNGEVAESWDTAGARQLELTKRIELDRPGWFLVRAIADVEHTFRFASTAPWYVESESGVPYVKRNSVKFFLTWLDERIARINATVSNPLQLDAILMPHMQARRWWRDKWVIATE